MKLVKWRYGFRCFGFAFYLRPERNPTIGFSRAGGWGLFIGRWTFQSRRA